MTGIAPDGANTPTPNAQGGAHHKALDGLRGLAIILVFMGHIYDTSNHLKTSWLGGVIASLGNWGWLGVDLFFVLSGFLITGILINSVNAPRFFRNFYTRRALRIFPLFYGVLLLLALLTPVLHLAWHRGHIAYLFYCQNIAMNVNPSLAGVDPIVYLGHFWSLAVEEQYYLVWPLVIWLLRDELRIMRLCLMLVACCVLLRIALTIFFPPNVATMTIYWELPTHCDGLLLGSWLALAIRRWPVEELRRSSHLLVWIAFAVFLAVGVYAHSLGFQTPAMETIGFSVIPFVLASLLLRCFVPGSAVTQFCNLRFLRFMGRYSYGFYVYQMLFVVVMQMGLHWLQAHLHSRALAGFVYILLWYSATISVAVLSYKYFESPFLRLKERLAPSRQAPATSFTDRGSGVCEA